MKKLVKNNVGLILCISLLIFYFLLKLPFNLSVLGQTDNEGFYFVFGQNFLKDRNLIGGIFFLSLYSLILKFFGFNSLSIIAIHFVQTMVVMMIGVSIYFVVKKILKSSIYGSLGTLLWLILIIAPLGTNLKYEIMSHFSFEAEYLCTLFSLLAILFFLLGGFFNQEQPDDLTVKEKAFSFSSGIFSVLPVLCKTNGGSFLIAVILWGLILAISIPEKKKYFLSRMAIWFCGVIVAFIGSQILTYSYDSSLIEYWRRRVLVGSYSNSYLFHFSELMNTLSDLVFRKTKSLNNLVLFLISIILFSSGVIRYFIFSKTSLTRFLILIGIWGFGGICSIIFPGKYEPYYYHLIWVQIAIVFTVAIFEINNSVNNKQRTVIGLIICLFFGYRVYLAVPVYCDYIKEINKKSIFRQKQSIEDPVLPYNLEKINRQGELQFADAINVLLPDKKSTFYVLNLGGSRLTCLTPLSYIYAKRMSPSNIISELLYTRPFINEKLVELKGDLINKSPDIFILSKDVNLPDWLEYAMRAFLPWFNEFLKNNYTFITTLECSFPEENRIEYFAVYEKNGK